MSATNQQSTVTIRYFAWVREKTGTGSETLTLPADVSTVRDLALWMQQRGDGFAAAFAKPDAIRAALDQKHVAPNTKIAGAREVAFFPPVTGG